MGVMCVKNVQISFDEDLLDTVDELAAAAHLTRSAIVREALKNWVRQREVKNFEDEWIARLKQKPQDLGDVEAWAEAESWSDE
jgi:metal-responsive CopG/Arc/MetJ family transcriptional regulator